MAVDVAAVADDLVTSRHSYCCSDSADTIGHPVVEDGCLDVGGDHCFPVPNAKPFAFSDPKISKQKEIEAIEKTTRFIFG